MKKMIKINKKRGKKEMKNNIKMRAKSPDQKGQLRRAEDGMTASLDPVGQPRLADSGKKTRWNPFGKSLYGNVHGAHAPNSYPCEAKVEWNVEQGRNNNKQELNSTNIHNVMYKDTQ